MPYILSPKLTAQMPGMWFEGAPVTKEEIYSIQPGKMPPVNYDKLTIKSHSIPHAEGSLHVLADGKSVDQYFEDPRFFYGSAIVVRLRGNSYREIDKSKGLYHWEVSLSELKEGIDRVQSETKKRFEKLILTTDFYPKNADGFHDPNYVLTLSQEAASYLASLPGFNMYGTSWKSSDFMPGSAERPIHKTLFSKAVILELLELEKVPEGTYFFVGFPLRVEGTSESPVCPVLFEKNEISI